MKKVYLIRISILVFWALFWLLNSLDKIFGGSFFLWVGRDRFAQFQKFFASAGLEAPWVANLGLVIAAGLEIFAFVFFAGALYFFLKKKGQEARYWFFIGIVLTLSTFTFFAIGDHIFGDRFELLEHTLFWFVTIFSWVFYIKLDQIPLLQKEATAPSKWAFVIGAVALLTLITSYSIFRYNQTNFHQRSSAVAAELVGDNTYKVAFPFLGGSTVFENSLQQFKEANPSKRIKHIYTAPGPLRLKKADGLIFYILTEDKE